MSCDDVAGQTQSRLRADVADSGPVSCVRSAYDLIVFAEYICIRMTSAVRKNRIQQNVSRELGSRPFRRRSAQKTTRCALEGS